MVCCATEKIVAGFKSEKKSVKQKEQEIEFASLKEEIQRKLGTKVNISGTNKKGKIEIYYYSLEDLERIAKELKFNC